MSESGVGKASRGFAVRFRLSNMAGVMRIVEKVESVNSTVASASPLLGYILDI